VLSVLKFKTGQEVTGMKNDSLLVIMSFGCDFLALLKMPDDDLVSSCALPEKRIRNIY
jgi:hypothetical protein